MTSEQLSGKKIHFVGIGGIGMSGLARLLLVRGFRVSGSDVKESSLLSDLRREGATIALGHRESNLQDAGIVVFSSCIQEDNPERKEAVRRALLQLSRGELLALLFKEKKIGIAISGSHGKTTTTALATWLLRKGGLDPTYFIGGISRNLGGNAGGGGGTCFVTEADESDGSFLALPATYSMVTNMDAEHLDYYKTLERSLEAYADFLNQTDPQGKVFVSSDCPYTARVLKELTHPRPVTFGSSSHADYFPENVKREGNSSRFDCVGEGEPLGTFRVNLPGHHNIVNSMGVIALGVSLSIPIPVIQDAVESFEGVKRRLEMRHFAGLTVVEDYAHHPTEVKATLEALRGFANGRRIVGVFQPHRYTRTQLLAKAFGGCFRDADLLIVTDIYGASEPPIPGVDAELILKEVRRVEKDKPLFYFPKSEIIPPLLGLLRPNDILIIMGAGDINEVACEVIRLCDQGAFSWTGRSYETV